MKSPNLFYFATSELSQDAMLAWLMSWADDDLRSVDEELCILGKRLVSLLSQMPEDEIHSVLVRRQEKHIDISAEINDDTFLVLEDKTQTGIHSNQLSRYKKWAEERYKGKRLNLKYVYVKTGNEQRSRKRTIENQGYYVVYRQQLLDSLSSYTGNNHIVIEFRNHLQTLEDDTNKYRNIPVSEWNWSCWQGFYMALENYKLDSGWDYVANPSGGFLGFWWHFNTREDAILHLQFEMERLCVKIERKDNESVSKIRDTYYAKLIKEAKKRGLPVTKPARFGKGKHVTIGVVDEKYIWGDGLVEIDKLITKLHAIEDLVDDL